MQLCALLLFQVQIPCNLAKLVHLSLTQRHGPVPQRPQLFLELLAHGAGHVNRLLQLRSLRTHRFQMLRSRTGARLRRRSRSLRGLGLFAQLRLDLGEARLCLFPRSPLLVQIGLQFLETLCRLGGHLLEPEQVLLQRVAHAVGRSEGALQARRFFRQLLQCGRRAGNVPLQLLRMRARFALLPL